MFLCFEKISVTNLSQKLAQTKYQLTNTDRFASLYDALLLFEQLDVTLLTVTMYFVRDIIET